MADILSQDEVDMLLSSVSEEGGGDGDEYSAPSQATLGRLSTYEFRRPERVSKDLLKGLQSLFEALARELSITLPPFLRTAVRVELTSVDQLTYDEFILSVGRPTTMSVVHLKPLAGKAVIELSPSMVFPIVDRVLGGQGQSLAIPRELTEIENGIIRRIVLMVLGSWKRAWSQLLDFDLSIENQEGDPLIVQIVAGSDMVVLVGCDVYIGETVGSMSICVPLVSLSPILDQISRQSHFQKALTPETEAAVTSVLEDRVRNATVTVTPILGQATLRLSDIANLQPDDVITLDSTYNQPIRVEVGGVTRFLATPGRRGERGAVRVESLKRD